MTTSHLQELNNLNHYVISKFKNYQLTRQIHIATMAIPAAIGVTLEMATVETPPTEDTPTAADAAAVEAVEEEVAVLFLLVWRQVCMCVGQWFCWHG